MLQLTPLDETWAGRELIAKGKADMLGSLLQAKFGISESELPPALFRMTSNELDGLSKVIFSAESYQQAEWLILAIVGSRVSN